MAKLIVDAGVPDFESFTSSYHTVVLSKNSARSVTFTDTETGAHFVLKGKGLSYDGLEMTGGTITSGKFYSEFGGLTATLTDISLKVNSYEHTSQYADPMVDAALSRRDTIIGSNDDDQLFGGKGNDIITGKGGDDYFTDGLGNDKMTGGRGRDEFTFIGLPGTDVITDFNTGGSPDQHDHLFFVYMGTYELTRSGHDTLIHFSRSGASEIRLLDVLPRELDSSDFGGVN